MHFIRETDRLRIRRFDLNDAPFIQRLLNTRGWLDNIGDRGIKTEEDALKYLKDVTLAAYTKHGYGTYLVEILATGEPAGMAGILRRDTLPGPDLGFAFLPEHTEKGYAHEAVLSILDHAEKDLKITGLYAITLPSNNPSIKLLEKLGFEMQKLISLANDPDLLRLYYRDVTQVLPK
jgi:RimJ/RimL family protein N-acetyltransferase